MSFGSQHPTAGLCLFQFGGPNLAGWESSNMWKTMRCCEHMARRNESSWQGVHGGRHPEWFIGKRHTRWSKATYVFLQRWWIDVMIDVMFDVSCCLLMLLVQWFEYILIYVAVFWCHNCFNFTASTVLRGGRTEAHLPSPNALICILANTVVRELPLQGSPRGWFLWSL